ncbi:CHAD domain-containing protein [Luteibacter sp. UNCMF331Sha3.1]|uniref:CHAD domain-containing protein n=1 Tax=Luteibacter sp. UNCMF331Sha3.1 TaxID=1502760 RepID=UPI0008B145E8|nr:CHAD domain-containing protein [Luteibacter sp. UNCMF331Sha3.1]SEN13753.1 CHAD domain-containing protein [Luteibacter sp. UNCMF331Sha3.1]
MSPAQPPRLAEALAALAARECRAAERALADTKRRHRGVHEARKAIRRLKSLLLLGRKPFADTLPAIERALAQLAGGLSPLRDARVAADVARSLVGPSPSLAWRGAIETLEHRCEGHLVEALHKDPRFLKRRRMLRELGVAIAGLPWRRLGRARIEKELARSEKRVHKACKRATKDPTSINLHTWRRRVRRLRMQREAWRGVAKAIGIPPYRHARRDKAETRALSKLSDTLGARQDLKALNAVLGKLGDPATVSPLRVQVREALKAL